MHPPQSDHPRDRHARSWAYVLVALIALLAGYLLGLFGGAPAGASRADWPPSSSDEFRR